MKCPKCDAFNIEGSSFCVKCGTNLKELLNQTESTENSNNQGGVSQINVNQSVNIQEENSTMQMNKQVKTSNATSSLNYFMFIIAILIKPFKSFREEESKLSDIKNSFILALIISSSMTILNLIKTIINYVHVKSYNLSMQYTYSWQWDNLKNIKWLSATLGNFMIFAILIFGIAAVYYLGSLVIKKQLNFMKSVSITSVSFVPIVIGAMIISPIIGSIWAPLGSAFTIAGFAYSLIILYELINNELKLEGDLKLYFNLVCFGILGIVGYYVIMKIVIGNSPNAVISSTTLNSIMDLFK